MLRNRVPATPARVMRGLGVAAVVTQAGIAVTGSVVRVTGSGLGCPDWPACHPDSLVPTSHSDIALLHQWVEFGNRMLVGVVSAVAVACLLAALAARPRHRRLTVLAAAMPLGVLAQAALGGVTVLLGLAWQAVALHFLLSSAMVWLAVLLAVASSAPDPAPALPRPARLLVTLSSALLAAVLCAGTLVTAAGPHAGDAKTPRLGLPVPALAQVHADLLVGYLGLLVGLGFLLSSVGAPAGVRRRYRWLVAAVLAQGALGATQYALGVPETLVSLHVLGASLVTIAAAALWASAAGARPAAPAQDRVAEPSPGALTGVGN